MRRKVIFLLWTAYLGLLSGLAWFTYHHAIYNATTSLPGMFYLIRPEAPQRGSAVLICPQGVLSRVAMNLGTMQYHGQCPGQDDQPGTTGLIKLLMGLPGDRVRADGTGDIVINDQVLPRTRPHPRLPVFNTRNEDYILGEDEYLVLTPHADGFDSRYFGPVHQSEIQSTLRLFW